MKTKLYVLIALAVTCVFAPGALADDQQVSALGDTGGGNHLRCLGRDRPEWNSAADHHLEQRMLLRARRPINLPQLQLRPSPSVSVESDP
jgi:hypothetical protein